MLSIAIHFLSVFLISKIKSTFNCFSPSKHCYENRAGKSQHGYGPLESPTSRKHTFNTLKQESGSRLSQAMQDCRDTELGLWEEGFTKNPLYRPNTLIAFSNLFLCAHLQPKFKEKEAKRRGKGDGLCVVDISDRLKALSVRAICGFVL